MRAIDVGGSPCRNGAESGVAALTAIDLFSGAGGLSEGFRQAGFSILAGSDFDQHAAETFRRSHPDSLFFEQRIQDLRPRDILEKLSMGVGELDVLLGGPPCQAFSVYNHQRGMHDERSGLFREYIRVVGDLMPRFVVMENVTGITSIDRGRAVDEIYRSLESLGYHVEHRVLRAEEFGVPQERRRIFFLASRDLGEVAWPARSHGHQESPFDRTGGEPFVTVEDAIGDLPALQLREGEEVSRYDRQPSSHYQRTMRAGSSKLFNHVAPSLGEINVRRMKHIPQGGSWRDIPHLLLPAGMKKAKRSDHTKRYGRLHPDGLSSTILTKCDPHWGAFIHYGQERTLTAREAARLQSFPDRMRFFGPRMEQFRQVGNAVPPLLARAVAQPIAEMLVSGTDVELRKLEVG